MLEIRIHGRGGQGAVTAAQILAIAAFYDKKQCQAFPKFGVERRGAPVESYCRISKYPIHIRSNVYAPDIVLVLDPSLMESIDIAAGLKKQGIIIINTEKEFASLKKYKKFKLFSVDVSGIALSIFKTDIVNTCILGAFAKITNQISLKSLLRAIEDKFEGRQHLIDMNKQAIQKAFNLSQ